MARSFNGTSQYAQYAGAVVTGYPFTLAAWVKPGVNGLENDFVLSLSDVSETAVYQAIILGGGTVGDEGKVLAVSRNTTLAAAKTSAAMSAGTWNHAAGVFSSATSRAAYLNGGNKGTETTNITFAAGIDTTAIGRLSRPTPAAYFHGSCAEAGVWAAALSDEEIAALAAGLSPLQVRPQSLVAYWPLFARATNEEDWVGGNTLAVTGATAADHPRIIYPAWPEIILPAAAASGNVTVNLTGNGLTASTGNVTVTGGASVSPTGVELTPSVGTVTVDTAGNVTVNLTGNSLTATAGTPTVTGGASVTPTGNALSSAVGTVEATGTDANVTVNLTGVALASSVGSVSVSTPEAQQIAASLRGGSGGGGSGPEYRGDSIAYRYGVSTPGIAVRREPLEEADDTEESPEPEKSVVPEAQPSLTLEDVRRAYRKLAALEVSEPIRATRDEIEREIAEAQADQAALRALMIRIDAVLTEIRQDEDEIAMLLMMAAAA
jgi:hypothetical protein